MLMTTNAQEQILNILLWEKLWRYTEKHTMDYNKMNLDN